MARYIKEYKTSADPQTIHASISQYLMTEGYEYINYDGENVFKKGKGVVANPTFFKFYYYENTVRMETWMKYAFFPGVYIGELGITGFVGSAAKGPWKKRIFNIENALANFATQAPFVPPVAQVNASPTNVSEQPYIVNGKIATAQAEVNTQPVQNDSSYTYNTQQPLPPAGYSVSRKEFIEKYAQPSLKKNITSIAILCYVCAGLTFIVSCLIYPLGIIDAVVLTGFALGMHLGKSKVCAILILILSIIEVIMGIVIGSVPIWWLIAGISAVITFNKIDKQYKAFLNRK